jgi:hypothetical protein
MSPHSQQADDALLVDALPRQSHHQCLKLRMRQRQWVVLTIALPGEPALMQTARRQPDAEAVVDETFNRFARRLAKRYALCGLAQPDTATTLANAVCVPTRMSSGVVASHTASIRINAATRVAKPRSRQQPAQAKRH